MLLLAFNCLLVGGEELLLRTWWLVSPWCDETSPHHALFTGLLTHELHPNFLAESRDRIKSTETLKPHPCDHHRRDSDWDKDKNLPDYVWTELKDIPSTVLAYDGFKVFFGPFSPFSLIYIFGKEKTSLFVYSFSLLRSLPPSPMLWMLAWWNGCWEIASTNPKTLRHS